LTFKDKLIEVSTFRSGELNPETPSDIYGSIEQDAKRRDFTLNALYYNPLDGQLIDFNDSMKDMQKKRVRSVLPLNESFIEDPVRMIRAIKYSVTTNFILSFDIRRAIKRDAGQLSRISSSRLTEEVIKILSSGYSAPICEQLQKYKLLVYILPEISTHPYFSQVISSLASLDERISSPVKKKGSHKEVISRSKMILSLVQPLMMIGKDEEETDKEFYTKVYKEVKRLIQPITPANYDVEHSAAEIVKSFGIVVSSSWFKARKPLLRQPRVGKRGSGRKGKYPKAKGTSQTSPPRAKQRKSTPSV
jgi:poly(A) polymerase